MARLHLEPARVRELQQALIGAKYLQGEPTGEWDSATRDAMLRYQQDNGFSATGLPDAKSLMKLGLGPHPLPPDVATTSSTSAGADPSPKSDSDNIAPSPSPSSTVSAPPKQEK